MEIDCFFYRIIPKNSPNYKTVVLEWDRIRKEIVKIRECSDRHYENMFYRTGVAGGVNGG
jgi:hypothetical protein